MQRSFLLHGFLASVATSVLLLGACGGKVVFEATEGAGGGHGGAAQSSSSSSGSTTTTSGTTTTTSGTTTTTTSGTTTSSSGNPGCGCTEICANLVACGVPSQQCDQLCPNATPAQQQCLCALPPGCQGLAQCLNMGGQDGGPPPPMACTQCRVQADQNQCAKEFQICQQNTDCAAIRKCHKQCGYGPSCVQQCDDANPNGKADFDALMQCSVCQACAPQCSADPIFNSYCVLAGP